MLPHDSTSPLPPMNAPPPAGTALLFDGSTSQWRRFDSPTHTLVAHRLDEVRPALAALESAVAAGQWAAGFLSYEASPAFDAAYRVAPATDFPLLWFGLYDAPTVGELPPLGPRLALDWQPTVEIDDYLAAIARVKAQIAAGATYQVNYSYRLRAPFVGDDFALWRQMVAPHRPGYAAYLSLERWAIGSASPELFFERDGATVRSKPMKGTAPRGLWPADDLAKATWLRESAKNQAENVMIVDMVRNDLAQISAPGTVRVPQLFEVERHPTVWQMTSTVACESDASLTQLFGALFPASSITGAPKVRTMGIIEALESTPRQIYTGAIGFVGPAGEMQFNVAIRTALVDRVRGIAEYGTGGGIVWDSEARAERAEALTKTQLLSRAWPDFALLETMRWTAEEGYALIQRHLARLKGSADYFGFAYDEPRILTALGEAALGLPRCPHRVRLTVDRQGRPTVEASPLGNEPPSRLVGLAPQPIDSRDPFLYHKTTHRVIYDAMRRGRNDCDDVLLWNERGELTESTIANLVVQLGGERFTPPVECGLLAGTLRAHLLDTGLLRERTISREELAEAEALYLINSVRGLWEVEER